MHRICRVASDNCSLPFLTSFMALARAILPLARPPIAPSAVKTGIKGSSPQMFGNGITLAIFGVLLAKPSGLRRWPR